MSLYPSSILFVSEIVRIEPYRYSLVDPPMAALMFSPQPTHSGDLFQIHRGLTSSFDGIVFQSGLTECALLFVSTSLSSSGFSNPMASSLLFAIHIMVYCVVFVFVFVLYYIVLCYIILYYTLHYILLHYILLHYITLHYITLHYITLYYYCALHYITLHMYIHIYINYIT